MRARKANNRKYGPSRLDFTRLTEEALSSSKSVWMCVSDRSRRCGRDRSFNIIQLPMGWIMEEGGSQRRASVMKRKEKRRVKTPHFPNQRTLSYRKSSAQSTRLLLLDQTLKHKGEWRGGGELQLRF